jgi:hypothetical protein
LYIIDLEELGYQEEKPMREAIQFTNDPNETYLTYMNTPFKQQQTSDDYLSLSELYNAMSRDHL